MGRFGEFDDGTGTVIGINEGQGWREERQELQEDNNFPSDLDVAKRLKALNFLDGMVENPTQTLHERAQAARIADRLRQPHD